MPHPKLPDEFFDSVADLLLGQPEPEVVEGFYAARAAAKLDLGDWAGDPEARCDHPGCPSVRSGRATCSSRTVRGVGRETQCEVCGFTFSGARGRDLAGRWWKRDPKKTWVLER